MRKKILIISSPDINESAGIVGKYVMESLVGNFEVNVLTKIANTERKDVIGAYSIFELKLKKIESKIIKFFSHHDSDYYMFDSRKKMLLGHKSLMKRLNNINYDLIICVFIHDLTTTSEVVKLSKLLNSKLVFFPMDMHFLTGGCHYSWDCKKYETECGGCPGIKSSRHNDSSYRVFKKSFEELKDTDVTVIAPSHEVYEQLVNSKLFRNQKIVCSGIPIDSSVMYEVENRQLMRSKLGIKSKNYVIFCGAVYLNQRRKGGKELNEIFSLLAKRIKTLDCQLVINIAGFGDVDIPDDLKSVVNRLGYLNTNQLRDAFNCADIFINTSIQDSGPMMINQSMMCGTPVISFSVGVAKNLVINGVTGFSCKSGEIEQFVENIIYHFRLDEKERLLMRKKCKENALSFSGYEIFQNEIFKIIND